MEAVLQFVSTAKYFAGLTEEVPLRLELDLLRIDAASSHDARCLRLRPHAPPQQAADRARRCPSGEPVDKSTARTRPCSSCLRSPGFSLPQAAAGINAPRIKGQVPFTPRQLAQGEDGTMGHVPADFAGFCGSALRAVTGIRPVVARHV